MLLDDTTLPGTDNGGSPIQGDSFDAQDITRGSRVEPPTESSRAKVRQFVDRLQQSRQAPTQGNQSGGMGSVIKNKAIDAGASMATKKLQSSGAQNNVRAFADKWKDQGSAIRAGKEFAKDKLKQVGVKQLQKRVSSPALKAGLGALSTGLGNKDEAKERVREFAKDKLKEKAKDLTKNAAKNVAKQAGKQLAKQGTKVGAGAVLAVAEGGAAFTGIGLVIDILIDIALFLGFNDAFDGIEAWTKGNISEGTFLLVKSGMTVLMGFLLIIAVILTLAPPYFFGLLLFIPLNIYAILGTLFKKVAVFQGMNAWMKAVVLLYDVIAIYVIVTFLAGLLYMLCTTTGLASSSTVSSTVVNAATSVYAWFTNDPVAAAIKDACKYVQ